MQYSKQLNELNGTADQKIEQLRNQLQRVQEETEDMIRDLKKRIAELETQLEAIKKGE